MIKNLALHGNYVDLIIIIILLLYVREGIKRGFWPLVGDLISFIGSFAIALRAYPVAAAFLTDNFSLPNSYAKAIGFIALAILAQTAIDIFIGWVTVKTQGRVSQRIFYSPLNRALAVIPAVIDASILLTAFLTLLIALPISPQVKADILNSKIGGWYVTQARGLEKDLSQIFGGAVQDTLTFITVSPKGNENINLHYKPAQLTVDEEAEKAMFNLVNQERVKVGVRPLILDARLTQVARAHSRDMWERQYFSHVDPDGKDPFARMKAAGIQFTTAGENIALAPTTQIAHEGLMNSPGHKRNILDPNFGKVGIGVVDGGIYGKMFTQDFTD